MPIARLLPLTFLALGAFAQDHVHGVSVYDSPGPNRSFALVQGSTVMVNGSWQSSTALNRYADSHPGRYIVFLDGDTLHRLTDPSRIAEAERAYGPMLPLEARQKELAAQQKPLADQQHVLAGQQHDARGNPEEQARIGREQGLVGQQQGAIGRQQGEIGRQQGEIGRAFYNKVQGMLTTCLADASCPAIPAEGAQR